MACKQKSTNIIPGMNKSPISYYGSKHNMLVHILPLIPKHRIYVEPFFGSGTVFFAKQKANTEVINDIDDNVVHFYKTLQDPFKVRLLEKKIKQTLCSRTIFHDCQKIVENPTDHSSIDRAWAFFVVCIMSFGSKMYTGGWAYGWNSNDTSHQGKKIRNRIDAFSADLFHRMRHVQIDCLEVNYFLSKMKASDMFVYLDPPYISADMGHYANRYSLGDFVQTLDILVDAPFKWLMSSYPEHILLDYVEMFGWNHEQYDQRLCVSNKYHINGKTRRKIECLTWNYDLKNFAVPADEFHKSMKDKLPTNESYEQKKLML